MPIWRSKSPEFMINWLWDLLSDKLSFGQTVERRAGFRYLTFKFYAQCQKHRYMVNIKHLDRGRKLLKTEGVDQVNTRILKDEPPDNIFRRMDAMTPIPWVLGWYIICDLTLFRNIFFNLIGLQLSRARAVRWIRVGAATVQFKDNNLITMTRCTMSRHDY